MLEKPREIDEVALDLIEKPKTSEQMMMLELLTTEVEYYLCGLGKFKSHFLIEHEEAKKWIFGHGKYKVDYPFSFDEVWTEFFSIPPDEAKAAMERRFKERFKRYIKNKRKREKSDGIENTSFTGRKAKARVRRDPDDRGSPESGSEGDWIESFLFEGNAGEYATEHGS